MSFIDTAVGWLKSGGQGTKDGAVPAGAISNPSSSPSINVNSRSLSKAPDQRVRILVPDGYLRKTTRGAKDELMNIGGIIFPYTPTISFEQKADYAEQKLMHANYNMYFYQRSYVTPITISGKFTVQNDKDAAAYLATLHLLRAITKMQAGGDDLDLPDSNPGAPPPVCRLKAYGDFMLDNVPVVVTSFRLELPDNVDYYTLGNFGKDSTYQSSTVPTISSITITCNPMYSRSEMQKFSVNGWLSGALRPKGYL